MGNKKGSPVGESGLPRLGEHTANADGYSIWIMLYDTKWLDI